MSMYQIRIYFHNKMQIFRHGERTLAIKYPTDEYALNITFWPDGDGQLVN